MIIQILSHTPTWVFVLFAILLWLGAKQLLANSVSLTRVTLLPIAMTALSIYGMASAFGDAPLGLIAWVAAAIVLAALAVSRPLPATTRYDAASRRFHLAGSAVPLALMMGIFVTKYVVGVLLALHPEMRQQAVFAVGIGALYGAFSGIFSARALRLWRLAIQSDRAALAA